MSKEDTQPALVPRLRFPEFREDSAWNTSRLGDFATIVKGKGISKADITPDGTVPAIRYAELYTVYDEVISEVVSHTHLDPDSLVLSEQDDVIIPASGETKADIATAASVSMGGVALGSDLNIIRSHLHGPFFSYYLNGSKRRDIAKVAQGDTVAHLYPGQLENVEVSYPTPDEQRKIAECLGSLDDLIAAEGRKLAALRDHKQGLMQQLFPREGESQPRLRFPEFRDAGAWEPTVMDDLASIQSGGTPSKSNPGYWGGSIPWVSAKDMKAVRLSDTEDHVTDDAVEDGAKEVPAGTVLMLTRGMTLLKDVPICLLERPMTYNQDVKALRPRRGVVSEFLTCLLLASKPSLRAMVDIAGHGTGRLNTDEVKGLELSKPTPDEQRRIADCLSALDARIAGQSAKLDALRTHKRGLMQQLFPSPEDNR